MWFFPISNADPLIYVAQYQRTLALPLAERKQRFTHSKTPFAILLKMKIQNASSSPKL